MHKERGLSLIELLVTLAVAMVMLLSSSQLLLRAWQMAQNLLQRQVAIAGLANSSNVVLQSFSSESITQQVLQSITNTTALQSLQSEVSLQAAPRLIWRWDGNKCNSACDKVEWQW